MYLGNSQLSLDNLIHYAPQLQKWDVANLLLYGCNVAAGDAGKEFITKLHALTGAEIAASKTLTGSAAKGGNWELEVTTGQAELTPTFSPEVMATYPGVMSVVAEDEFVNGTPNNDIFKGTASADLINGLAGSDRLYGNAGNDTINDGDGDDIAYGGNDNDALLGGNGSDRLYGDAGNDELLGDAGNDILYGGDGDDLLNGDAGSDRLYGNAGIDTFVLASGMGLDSIYNFQDGADIIRLEKGLTFRDLQIAQSGSSTLIKIASTGVTLASLVNTNSALIGATDFSSASAVV